LHIRAHLSAGLSHGFALRATAGRRHGPCTRESVAVRIHRRTEKISTDFSFHRRRSDDCSRQTRRPRPPHLSLRRHASPGKTADFPESSVTSVFSLFPPNETHARH